MWDLVSWPGVELGPPAWEAQSLSHWSPRKVPLFLCLSAGPPEPLSCPSPVWNAWPRVFLWLLLQVLIQIPPPHRKLPCPWPPVGCTPTIQHWLLNPLSYAYFRALSGSKGVPSPWRLNRELLCLVHGCLVHNFLLTWVCWMSLWSEMSTLELNEGWG